MPRLVDYSGRRRRHRPARHRDESPAERATTLLLGTIPAEESLVREELAWLHLVLWARRGEAVVGDSPEGSLRDRYQVAFQGYVGPAPAPHQEEAVEELLALTDGLTWAVCTRRIRPEAAHAVVRRAVDRWSSSPEVRSPPP